MLNLLTFLLILKAMNCCFLVSELLMKERQRLAEAKRTRTDPPVRFVINFSFQLGRDLSWSELPHFITGQFVVF